MRGSIIKRKTGYFVVYDAGTKWDEAIEEMRGRSGCPRDKQ